MPRSLQCADRAAQRVDLPLPAEPSIQSNRDFGIVFSILGFDLKENWAEAEDFNRKHRRFDYDTGEEIRQAKGFLSRPKSAALAMSLPVN